MSFSVAMYMANIGEKTEGRKLVKVGVHNP